MYQWDIQLCVTHQSRHGKALEVSSVVDLIAMFEGASSFHHCPCQWNDKHRHDGELLIGRCTQVGWGRIVSCHRHVSGRSTV